MEEIRIPPITVRASLREPPARVTARGLELVVDELPEHGGSGEYFTPLEAFLAGIASCEVFMYRMILEKMGYASVPVEIECRGWFEIGEGVKRLEMTVRVSGVEEDVAVEAWRLVQKYCPLYATLRRAGVVVEERLEVGGQP